jgi:hypothetical protein
VARVTPTLNKMEGVTQWKVNTTVPEKTLEIKTEVKKHL